MTNKRPNTERAGVRVNRMYCGCRLARSLALPAEGFGRRSTSAASTHATIRHHGFTLLEIVVVMILVAMLGSIIIISVKGHIDAAAIEQTVEQLQSLDRRVRRQARRTEQPALIQISRNGRTVELQSEADLSAAGISTKQGLPSQVRIDTARVGRSAGTGGNMTVHINANGQSRAYALHVATENGAGTWLVTLGLSGQQLRCKTEAQVDALLRP